MTKLYDIKETARLFNVSDKTVRGWITDKTLTGFKAGREWRFSEEDIQRCIATLREKSTSEDNATTATKN